MKRPRCIPALGLLVPVFMAISAHGQTVYWSEPNSIITLKKGRGDGLDDPTGAGLTIGRPIGIALDQASQRLFYTYLIDEFVDPGFLEAGVAASNVDSPFDLSIIWCELTSFDLPFALAPDIANGKIYWSDSAEDEIRVHNIDGSGGLAALFDSSDGIDEPRGIALDSTGGKVYWSESGSQRIVVGNLDGSGSPTTLFDAADGISQPSRLAIDVAGGKVYWSEPVMARIRCGNLDGSGVPSDLFDTSDGLSRPRGIALDLDRAQIYWADAVADTINRGNIDGSGSPVVLFGPSDGVIEPESVALDLTPLPVEAMPSASPGFLLLCSLALLACALAVLPAMARDRIRHVGSGVAAESPSHTHNSSQESKAPENS